MVCQEVMDAHVGRKGRRPVTGVLLSGDIGWLQRRPRWNGVRDRDTASTPFIDGDGDG